MSKTLLAAIDSSPQSSRVIAAAAEAAATQDAGVTVLNVRELQQVGKAGAVWYEEVGDAEAIASKGAKQVTDRGVPATFLWRNAASGKVARKIVEVAREVDAVEIVVGTHGRSNLDALVLGSVTHDLLRETDRPVLVVP